MAPHEGRGVVFAHRLKASAARSTRVCFVKNTGNPKMTPIHAELHRLMPRLAGRGRPTAVAAAVATALGVFLAPQAMSQSASSADLKDLKGQVEQLQRQIDRLQAQQAAAAQTAPAPAATAAAPAPATTNPAFHAGPVTVTFGGYTELATIYRNRNETADVGSNFNGAIPYGNSPNQHLSEFRESARQSRLSILAQGPQDGHVITEAWFEMDFLGAAPTANSNESNSYNLRMRNIYGTYNNKDNGFYMLAGQNWSLVTLEKAGLRARSEQVPLTIDAQYVPGFNWTRNPQVRFVEELSKKVSLGISFESPQALISNGPNALPANTVINGAGGSLFAPTNNYSLDVAPDVVVKAAFDPGYGHYEVFGLGRWFRDRAAGVNDTITGGGVGAGMILPVVKDVFDFQASFLTGSGIGRYGSAQLPDVTLRPDGKFATVKEFHALVGLSYRPTAAWTVYGYVGEEHADSKAYSAVVGANTLGYGYGSPLYDNSGCETLGSTKCAANTKSVQQATLGAWWKYYQGALGNLQFGLQGSYTKRQIFAGLGGNPDTNMTVGMLSFRYYPYQK
jgi:hypothetical protein